MSRLFEQEQNIHLVCRFSKGDFALIMVVFGVVVVAFFMCGLNIVAHFKWCPDKAMSIGVCLGKSVSDDSGKGKKSFGGHTKFTSSLDCSSISISL